MIRFKGNPAFELLSFISITEIVSLKCNKQSIQYLVKLVLV